VATVTGTTHTLYVNGAQAATATMDTLGYSDTVNVNLGRKSDGTMYLGGTVDDVRLYSKALTPFEVQSLYQENSYGLGEPAADFILGTTFEGGQYWVSRTKRSWTASSTLCESYGGHLATISSTYENSAVMMAAKLTPDSDACWIGGSDQALEGTWTWVTGEPFSYTNWNPGEPSGGSENCTAMWGPGGLFGTWNDASDGNLYYCIMEIEGPPDPEPWYNPTDFLSYPTTFSSATVSWTDSTGVPAPDNYLVKWSSVGYGDIVTPVDGVFEPDGPGVKNVAHGVQMYEIPGLATGTTYYVRIWPYTNYGSNVNYKLDSPLEGTARPWAVVVLTTGTEWTVPVGINPIRVWAIGGGGGGAGCPMNVDASSGGGGGAGGMAHQTFGVTDNQVITFTIGAAGTAGIAASDGWVGGDTSVTIGGTTITGYGGTGGYYNTGTAAAGGGYAVASFGANGGNGAGATGDAAAGGGGGGIGMANGTSVSQVGGTGGQSTDLVQLFAALAAGGVPTTGPGIGGGLETTPVNDKDGSAATGFGCGGGGAGWYGGDGGAGLYGGGGGGAAGYASGDVDHAGGSGGQGVVVIMY